MAGIDRQWSQDRKYSFGKEALQDLPFLGCQILVLDKPDS